MIETYYILDKYEHMVSRKVFRTQKLKKQFITSSAGGDCLDRLILKKLFCAYKCSKRFLRKDVRLVKIPHESTKNNKMYKVYANSIFYGYAQKIKIQEEYFVEK